MPELVGEFGCRYAEKADGAAWSEVYADDRLELERVDGRSSDKGSRQPPRDTPDRGWVLRTVSLDLVACEVAHRPIYAPRSLDE